MQTSTRWLARFLVTMLAAAAFTACPSHVGGQGSVGRAHGHAHRAVVLPAASAVFVRTEVAGAASGNFVHSLVATVTFDERHFATIGPPVQGRVASVNVVPGDHVNRGDVLLTIHSVDIASAQALVAETRNARILAEQTAARTADLVRDGAASEAERLQVAARAEEARDEERRAMASFTALGDRSGASDYELRSPIAGTVVERNVSVGSEVHASQGSSLITIADMSSVWVIADVYEQDLPHVHVNDESDVDVIAYPGRSFAGRITYVGDVVDPRTHAVHARIELQNPGNALRSGMFAHVTLRSVGPGAADVPTGAVLAHRDQYFVFVRNGAGGYVRREVRLGDQHGQHTIILDGLTPGESVVTEGAILLDAEANEAL